MRKKKSKFKFKPSNWIVLDIEDLQCIGRTWIGPEGDELVSVIADNGNTGCIKWSDVENPRNLTIMKKSEVEQSQTQPQQVMEEFDGKHKPLMFSLVSGEC